jgi:7 transmembrane receptor (rhodopsin family)
MSENNAWCRWPEATNSAYTASGLIYKQVNYWSRSIRVFRFQVSCTFDYLTLSTANIAYNYCLVTFQFIIPVAIIVTCYIGIVCSVSRHSADMTRMDAATAAKTKDEKAKQHEKQKFEQEMRLTKVRWDAGFVIRTGLGFDTQPFHAFKVNEAFHSFVIDKLLPTSVGSWNPRLYTVAWLLAHFEQA